MSARNMPLSDVSPGTSASASARSPLASAVFGSPSAA